MEHYLLSMPEHKANWPKGIVFPYTQLSLFAKNWQIAVFRQNVIPFRPHTCACFSVYPLPSVVLFCSTVRADVELPQYESLP